MLVLDRKVQEGFWIEGGIFVKVLGIGKHRVKLGIEAPTNLKIVRDELQSRSAGEAPDEGGRPGSDNESRSEGSLRSARRRN